MRKTLKDKDMPEPWLGKKKKPVTAPKQTRAASKLMAEQYVLDDDKMGQSSKMGKGQQKGKVQEVQ